MSAQAGQTSERAELLHCAQCDQTVYVNIGDQIPSCPNGHTNYV
jgi:hypothetical protein